MINITTQHDGATCSSEDDLCKIYPSKGESQLEPAEPLAINTAPSLRLIAEAAQVVLSAAKIHPNLIAGVVANAICRHYPQLTSTMEEVKKALPLPVEHKLLTATELAQLYYERTGDKLSTLGTPKAEAMAINKLLEEKGLQVKSPDNKQSWLATEPAAKYSQTVLQTGKNNDGTYQQLRWFPSVIDLLV